MGALDAFLGVLLQLARVAFVLLFALFALARRAHALIARLFSSKRDELEDKHVVVVGGGFSGAYLSQKLQNYCRVTLVDTRDYFEFTPSVLRTIVEPNHISSIQIRHQEYLNLHSSRVVQDRVKSVTDEHVVLASDDSKLSYDYLVLTPGSRYNRPFKHSGIILPQRGALLADCSRDARVASEQGRPVCIVGGGIVGVELAAELIERFPTLNLTLVHSGPRLMCGSRDNNSPVNERASAYAARHLESRGVKLLLGQRVINLEDVSGTPETDAKQAPTTKADASVSFASRVLVTDKEQRVQSDLSFLCTGICANTEFLRGGALGQHLDAKGFVKVDANLQVPGQPHIFAAGDATAWKEEKLAQNAEAQAATAAVNIVRAATGQPLKPYWPLPRPMLVSLGKLDGMLVFQGYALCGFLPALMKEFVEWKVMTSYRHRAGHYLWV